jgi:hypothetical protein
VRLEYATIGWNVLEAAVAVGSGIVAGSVALVAFGLDSAIEVVSATVVLVHLRAVLDGTEPNAARQRRALRIIAVTFFALAAYVSVDAVLTVLRADRPSASPLGLVVTAAAAVVMPALALWVAPVRGVVSPAVAQVDSPQEGDVELGPVVVAQDHELLVVGSPRPHPHVQQALPACVIDLISQLAVLLGREGEAVPVGAPDEPADVDTAPGRLREHRSDFRADAAGKALVGIASPVSEHQQVSVTHP